MKYVLGTRGSKLALVQTEYVRDRLAEKYPMHSYEIKIIKTTGDKITDKPLHEIGTKGLFVKEIEEQILEGKVDIGVHSMKDMPSQPEAGLIFTEPWLREDPRDALILREKKSLSELPAGAVIGTGSKRRQFQLAKFRPDIKVVGIRGNVDTRIKKMHEEKLDGIILAAAGLKRLHMEDIISEYLDDMIWAPAQGVLALEIRKDDHRLEEMLNSLKNEETAFETKAERGFLGEIGGSCHVPVGASCVKNGDEYELRTVFGREDGSRMAFSIQRGRDAGKLALDAANDIRSKVCGTAYLVGAGPGDPGLITARGLELIRSADCIIYDRLIPHELLGEAKGELIYAGKENRHHSMDQKDINALIAEKTLSCDKVVRLKGGDPFVFGRGGEEALYLKNLHIPFEIVPGISSAVAGPAMAGIPVTHRGLSSGFRVFTAHSSSDEPVNIDFDFIAQGKETCVILMGLSRLEKICEKLMERGMDPKSQIAVISNASTCHQQVCTGSLDSICRSVREAGLPSPAIIVTGPDVSLREKLCFLEKKPLWGKNFLIPFIEGTSLNPRLSQSIRDKGGDATLLKVGQIEYIANTLEVSDIADASIIIFTSRCGVEGFFRELARLSLDSRCLSGKKIGVIGGATGEELGKHGIIPDFMPPKATGKSMAETLAQITEPGSFVLYPKEASAENAITDAAGKLCPLKEAAVYRNSPVNAEKVNPDEFDAFVFTCSSSAERLISAVGPLGDRKVYSIGPKCTHTLRELGCSSITESLKELMGR